MLKDIMSVPDQAMSAETILTNAKIVLSDEVIAGTVVIRDGKIAAIDSGTSARGKDMEGDYLIPGLVELHTDHLEGHYAPRPKVRWNPLAALQAHDAQIAASGITTVFDALRVGHDGECEVVVDDMLLLGEAVHKAQAANRLRAEHFLHLRCEVSSNDCISAFERMRSMPGVRLASLMDHAPGQRQFPNLESFRIYYMRKNKVSDSDYQIYCDRRIAESERNSAKNRALIADYCHANGIMLASHDDATEAHVQESITHGVTVAEFPTTVEAAAASHSNGIGVMMGGPNVVRGGSHSGNVSALELAQQGYLDIISSDYIPFSMVQGAFSLAHNIDHIDLPQAIRMVSTNPAKAVGLNDRGAIAEGLRADMVRVHALDDVPVVRAVWRAGRRVS